MPRQRLPNHHENEKGAIDRTNFITPAALERPQQQSAPSFSEDTQIGVGYDSQSPMIFPSLLSIATRASIILPSQQQIRPGCTDIADLEASPLSSSVSKWSRRSSHPHSTRAMGGAQTLLGNPLARSFPSCPVDDLATQSSIPTRMPHETSSRSLIEPGRRTEVKIALPSHKAGLLADDDTRCERFPASSKFKTDASPSPPPFVSAVPSTYPSAKSQFTSPAPVGRAARSNPTEESLDEALLVPPFIPLAIVPNVPRFFNPKRTRPPPQPQSNLVKSSSTSIIAGQTSSGTRGEPSSPKAIASSSLMYKGVSKPSLPSSSMDRKVVPFPGHEQHPLSSPSKSRSLESTSSGSSYLTTVGPTPQSSCPDLPSPPSRRTCRLSMKRLLPAALPDSRHLVKFSSNVPEGSSIDAKTGLSDLATPVEVKSESGRTTLGDQVRSSKCTGSRIDSAHPVYSQPSSSSILSVFNKVLRPNDVVPLKEHYPSILKADMHSSKAQPDAQAVSTNSRVCGGEKGLSSSSFGRMRKSSTVDKSKEEEVDDKPARRRRNVLRKRSNPRLTGLSRSTSTLGSSRSPSEGHTKDHEEHAHRNRRMPDLDLTSIKQLQTAAVLERSEVENSHSGSRLFHGSPIASQPSGMKDIGLLTSVAVEGPGKRRQEAVSGAEMLTPAALIATECKARMSEGSRNSDPSYVASGALRESKTEGPTCDDMSIKDRCLPRSASMSEILFSNPGSVYGQPENRETIHYERDKLWDRARQSLNLSIAIHPDEDKLHKSADVISSKSGGRLRKLMRKFSISRSGGKRSEPPPMSAPSLVTQLSNDQSPSRSKPETRSRTPVRPSRLSFSNRDIPSPRQMVPKSSPPSEIPPLPIHPISVPLDLHIVNPSVLDQKYHEEEDRTQPSIQCISVLSSPKVPPEGEWIRSNSPDLELAALPLPPRRASKVSTGPPSHSGEEADDINHSRLPFVPVPVISKIINPQTTPTTFPPRSDSLKSRQARPIASTSLAKYNADLPNDVPNLTSYVSVIPSISVSPPTRRSLTNRQKPNSKRLFIGNTHPGLDPLRINTNIPPLHRKHSFKEYSSESSGTSSNHTIAQPVPSVRKSTLIGVEYAPVDPNSNSYLTFTRSSLNATPSVVFRPGTANTFGGSETLGSDRPGTSDSGQSATSTPTERVNSYSPLSGSSLRLTASPTSFTLPD